jgi:hypothetical protein
MQHDQQQLHLIAQDYPWYMFTVEEIALLCNVSRDVVSKVRAATDSPFCLNKCRPEWFADWMREHPDFQLTKGSTPEAGIQPGCTNVKNPVGSPPGTDEPRKLKRRKSSPKPLSVRK